MPKPAFFQVRESFIAALRGHEVEYHKGEVVDERDPALKKWPHQFEPLVLRGHTRVSPEPRVEQATAAPGEKRGG